MKKLKKIFERIFKKKFKVKFLNFVIDFVQWDSMSNLDFIFEIENYYNFKFKTKDLEKANSIRFFVTYLKKKGKL